MRIDAQQHGAVKVLRPDGPVCGEDADLLASSLAEHVRTSRGRVVLDAEEIAFADSVGLEVLSDTALSLRETGQALKIAGANVTLRTVFELTELDHLFEYFEDVTSAARSFL